MNRIFSFFAALLVSLNSFAITPAQIATRKAAAIGATDTWTVRVQGETNP